MSIKRRGGGGVDGNVSKGRGEGDGNGVHSPTK